MITLHKATYRFTTILIQMSMKIFTNMEQRILKFVWNHKKKWRAKEILRQNDRRVVLPDFKLYYKDVLIKQYGIAIKNGHKNHWNRIEIPEINPNICGQLIYDKKVEIIASGKDCLFKNGVVKAGRLHAKEWNWKTLTPFTKINSKWIKDFDHKSWSHKNPRRGTSLVAVVKNPPTNAGDSSVILDPGRSQMPRSNSAHSPELLSLCFRARERQLSSPCATTTEARCPPACSPQQKKPLQ